MRALGGKNINTNINLKAIGFWYSDDEKQFHHPSEFVGKYSSKSEKDKIINYLSNGHIFIDYMGYSFCRFGCKDSNEMGASEQTDGVWVWPVGLKHYVKKHNVLLSKEFILHAKSNNWITPDITLELSTSYNYENCIIT